jgi:uncharacterized damage-inducible protein DinB
VNDKLRRIAGELTDAQLRQRLGIGMGTPWATLVHLYAAEHVWLDAVTGGGSLPVPCDDSFDNLEQLLIAWEALERRWQRFLDDLTPGRLMADVTRKGVTTPALDVLIHVCTHAQYTTAQLVNMLRQLGVPSAKLPDCMMITLSRAEHRSP